MREAIANAPVGDEQLREDPTVNELERRGGGDARPGGLGLRPDGDDGERDRDSRARTARRRADRGGERAHPRRRARRAGRSRGTDDASDCGAHRALHARAGALDRPHGRPRPRADDADRRGREHAQRLGRARVASGRARGDGRHVPRARPLPPPRRRAPLQRRGRERGAAFHDRRARRHGHDLLLEGARLPARRDRRGLVGANAARAPVQAPVRRRDAPGGDRGRGVRLRARAQRRAPRGRPRSRSASRRGPRGSRGGRSTSSRSRRTSSRSTSARWASHRAMRRIGCSARASASRGRTTRACFGP